MVLTGIYIYKYIYACLYVHSLILFVIRSKQCSNNGFNTIEHIGRLLLFSDLLSFQRFKEFYASTTISTEDEPYKGLSNLVKCFNLSLIMSFIFLFLPPNFNWSCRAMNAWQHMSVSSDLRTYTQMTIFLIINEILAFDV